MLCQASRNTYKGARQFAAPALKSMIEHHNTIIIIPARMAATRLPGKPMADINGLPMIVHVWRRAVEAKIGHVMVAAAQHEIASAIKDQGGDAIVTEPNLPSGSDRVAAALALRDVDNRFEHVVNLQGDLPTIDPLSVRRCLAGLTNGQVDISTIAAKIDNDEDRNNPNVVKAIAPLKDREVAFARDFVRVLSPDHDAPHWHHIGIYAYRRAALNRFVSLAPTAREKERKLEQMRALDHGMKIAVVAVETVPLGVDAPADLEMARRILKDT
jgi:3-deoxy-manno-octulosonate cytidylyltransferase (CMP-KDO synthetase)